MSVTDLKTLATAAAIANNLNTNHFLDVINCESGWDTNIVGDHGTSFGLAQLHYPKRDWGISTTTATDPYTALGIMAKAWGSGQASRWTCYRQYNKEGWPSG